jgi:hypothetical protein
MPLSVRPAEILTSDLIGACGTMRTVGRAMVGEQKPDAVLNLLGRDATGPLWEWPAGT